MDSSVSVLSWRKRQNESDNSDITAKQQKVDTEWYSSSESIDSIQGRITDFVKDTTDTDWTDTDTFVEFEVASLSESDNINIWTAADTGSTSEVDGIIPVDVLAALCTSDSDLEAVSDETNSSLDATAAAIEKTRSTLCVNCKQTETLYRYCDRCYQARKNLFPPRPKGCRNRRQTPVGKSVSDPCIKVDEVKSCLRKISESQDSGVPLSQDMGESSQSCSLNLDLGLDKIVVPGEHIDNKVTNETTGSQDLGESSQSLNLDLGLDKIVVPKENKVATGTETNKAETSNGELCIVCNINPKNGIFVHGGIGHMCCCYRCAVKVWLTTHRCPACNCKVKNVLRAFLI